MDSAFIDLSACQSGDMLGQGGSFSETAFRSIFPEGVSLEYVLSADFKLPEGCHWYVMRVSYGREKEVAEALIQAKFPCFPWVPVRNVKRTVGGEAQYNRESWVPNLLFMLLHKDDIRDHRGCTIGLPNHTLARLSFCFDHTHHNGFGRDLPMTVPNADMLSFIRVIESHDEHVRIYKHDEIANARLGDRVRVTEGRFKGVTGSITRFRHQSVILVNLQGIAWASTAYVPKKYLEPVVDLD